MKKFYYLLLFGVMVLFLSACNLDAFTSGKGDQEQPPPNHTKKPTNQDENEPPQDEEQPPVTNEKSIETIVDEYFQLFNIHDIAKEQEAQQFFNEYLVASSATDALTAWKSNANASVSTIYYDFQILSQVDISGYDANYQEAKAVLVDLSSNNPNDNGRAFVVFVKDGGKDKIYQTIGETHVEFFNELIAYFPNELPSQYEEGNQGENDNPDSEGIPYGDFLVTDHYYDSDSQNEYVAGSVVNTSDYYYTFVEVEVALKDDIGNVLDYTYTDIEILGPGEAWDFQAIVTEPEATQYEITNIIGDKKEYGKSNIYYDDSLKLIDHSAYIEGNSTFVVGTVENISETPFSYVEVLVDLYDGTGNYLGFAWATIDNLQPGATWDFETTLDVQAVNYEIVHLIGW